MWGYMLQDPSTYQILSPCVGERSKQCVGLTKTLFLSFPRHMRLDLRLLDIMFESKVLLQYNMLPSI